MNEGDFTLMKIGWYTPQAVQENDFLNDKLENDTYGIFYSVQFVGDAETYLWQSKTKPNEGEKYWGHIEESKSGKSLKFRRDKDAPANTPDGKPSAATIAQEEKGEAITASMCVKLAFSQFCHVEATLPSVEEHWDMISYMADMLYKTIKKTGTVTQPSSGYEKAKNIARHIRNEEPLPEPPEENGR